MKIDPEYCTHTNLKKSVRVETVNVPELGIEQLCLKIRVYCGDCKSPYIIKTQNQGFSTDDIGVVGDELIVPLEYPQPEEDVDTDSEIDPSELVHEVSPPRYRDNLH
jgi:hypothetical protein